MSEKKYYVVVSPKCDTVLHSSTPGGAAAKAFSRCIKRKGTKTHRISLKQRGKEKVMKYSVKRVNKKRVVMRGDTEVVYKYATKVKSLN
jgi:hypothetical protein